MTATTANLMDHLQEQGYEPHEDRDWFDLTASGTGTIRVSLDDGAVMVFAFDKFMVCQWQTTMLPGTPDAVILAVIEAAEWQLAAKRGGPVTPAQAEAAR